MRLQAAVAQYVAFRKSAGADFTSSEKVLNIFCHTVCDETDIMDLRDEQVRAFVDGKGPVTTYWHRKQSALLGFYHYALSRQLVSRIPLSTDAPKRPPSILPYIYTREELRRLLDATSCYRKQRFHIEPETFRTLLLTLYGAGLRLGEALQLTLADADLPNAMLIIRETKFYKTRLVPLGPDLCRVVAEYAGRRKTRGFSQNATDAFFVDRDGEPLLGSTVRRAFRHLCTFAGVCRTDGARYQPRLHDLRHAFGVHRLTSWYKQGADVQKLLPQLSTYLGHISIAATQVYLTMTPELLGEASLRFERYAIQEANHG